MIFLKLGGSLLTNKATYESFNSKRMQHIAQQIAAARRAEPTLQLVLGHGSGSFGHMHATEHNTINGLNDDKDVLGFARVSDAALRLNRLVISALLAVDIPAITLSPMSYTNTENRQITHIDSERIARALQLGFVVVVHGDTVLDARIGGTIVSTEQVFVSLALALKPSRLLLAGETDGVLDDAGNKISRISAQTFDALKSCLGASGGTDVTGGMLSKVCDMLRLAEQLRDVEIRIFDGKQENAIGSLLASSANTDIGTRICFK